MQRPFLIIIPTLPLKREGETEDYKYAECMILFVTDLIPSLPKGKGDLLAMSSAVLSSHSSFGVAGGGQLG